MNLMPARGWLEHGFAQAPDGRRPAPEQQPAAVAVLRSLHLQFQLPGPAHHPAELSVGKREPHGCFDMAFHDPVGVERRRRGASVGVDQPGYAQFGAPEIPHHHHQDLGELPRTELPQDRVAGAVRWLAVVKGAPPLPQQTEPVGIAMMPGVEILPFI
jgi:hypothetical protein